MDIIVTGKHLEVTEAIRNYASTKVSKLPRYYDRIRTVDVVIDKHDHRRQDVEMIVHVDHHDPFLARVNGDDLYACIDQAVDKLERQLTEHKDKLRNRKHNG
jgi:putative sigma-54 modulation protein